ncbi:YceD family protein [Ascidiimonas sp. W6]|uniref:YceD family protein n=1 Tax=Ascidiimonas meishanensis TaxID=3128903 RepID=UPI0030EC0448
MKKLKEFDIPFVGLKQGKHQFNYHIDNEFFEGFDYNEFNEANLTIKVSLDKKSTFLELFFEADGFVNVPCDSTSEPYNQPIKAVLELVVKFGEEYNNEKEDLLIIPHGEFQINVAQYIYEMVILAVPAKRIHPGIEDGTLDSDILKRLEELTPKEEKKNENETDPRWDSLKKLLTDKK